MTEQEILDELDELTRKHLAMAGDGAYGLEDEERRVALHERRAELWEQAAKVLVGRLAQTAAIWAAVDARSDADKWKTFAEGTRGRQAAEAVRLL